MITADVAAVDSKTCGKNPRYYYHAKPGKMTSSKRCKTTHTVVVMSLQWMMMTMMVCFLLLASSGAHGLKCRPNSSFSSLSSSITVWTLTTTSVLSLSSSSQTVRTAHGFHQSAIIHHHRAPSSSSSSPSSFFRGSSSTPSMTALFQQSSRPTEDEDSTTAASLIRAALQLTDSTSSSGPLITLDLVGKTMVGNNDNDDESNDNTPRMAQLWNASGTTCLVLQSADGSSSSTSAAATATTTKALLVPLANPLNAQLALVESAHARQVLSNVQLWRLNWLAVNRDDGLFDGLPWSSWTVDPQKRNRDAAGNQILPKFHLGKRDAYQVMLGKDWRTKKRQKQREWVHDLGRQLQNDEDSNNDKKKGVDDVGKDSSFDDKSATTLAQRLLQLQIRELEMDAAEYEYQLAVARNNNEMKNDNDNADDNDPVETLETSKQACVAELHDCRQRLQDLTATTTPTASRFAVRNIWQQATTALQQQNDNNDDEKQRRVAPYRGATGYAPFVDDDDDGNDPNNDNNSDNDGPYTTPYDMLREILENQLQAKVLGAVLENTSWFEGTATLGGLVVLQRNVAKETTSVWGETVTASNPDEDFGNPNVTGGTVILVECDADEAISMSLACHVPLQIEADLFERAAAPVVAKRVVKNVNDDNSLKKNKPKGHTQIPEWQVVVDEEDTNVQGDNADDMSTKGNTPTLRIPRTSASLLEEWGAASSNVALFPTDNPIQTLSEYDELSNSDKARTLLTMSNFQGKLPRPRAVRAAQLQVQNDGSDDNAPPNALDALLLPLVDESVRRRFRIRDALRRGNEDEARALCSERSSRHVAQDAARDAREQGRYDEAEQWEAQVDLYDSLRADVTQDEGDYSRFLDRDDWYERDRQQTAARVNKKSFGTLLDMIGD